MTLQRLVHTCDTTAMNPENDSIAQYDTAAVFVPPIGMSTALVEPSTARSFTNLRVLLGW